jgi:cytochrome oxidase Cu insertion factor (SCO1/SenC/PrrC family)
VPISMNLTYAPVSIRARALCALWAALTLPILSGAGGHMAPAAGNVSLNRLPPSWRDDHGGTLELGSLQGQRIFVTMAYTSCHRICPMTMARLDDLQRELDARGLSAEFLVVSYDPSNDDSGAWHRYRISHRLLRDNWHFLSGTAADTERLARVLGFEFWRDGEHVMHDFRIVALGGDGAQRGFIDSAHRDWQDLL